jgi:hypothetical protein
MTQHNNNTDRQADRQTDRPTTHAVIVPHGAGGGLVSWLAQEGAAEDFTITPCPGFTGVTQLETRSARTAMLAVAYCAGYTAGHGAGLHAAGRKEGAR